MIKKEDKNICLTFDYELFFKKSGTLDKCIIKPVDLLIKNLKNKSIKGTFFIDILYYIKLLENKKFAEDEKKVKLQLQNLIHNGHRIELHIHTSWLDAEFNGNQWEFKNYPKGYRLHNFDEDCIMKIFSSGTNILNSIAREVLSDYKVIAFRAGGWCIQPFEKISRAFDENGLLIDSSVARNVFLKSESHTANFLNTPEHDVYSFSNDPLEIDENGKYFEIPIATYKKSIYEKILYKCEGFYNKKNSIFGDGMGLSACNKSVLARYFSANTEMFTLESNNFKLLNEKVGNYKFHNVVFISHPKGLSIESFKIIDKLYNEGYSFNELTSLIKRTDFQV